MPGPWFVFKRHFKHVDVDRLQKEQSGKLIRDDTGMPVADGPKTVSTDRHGNTLVQDSANLYFRPGYEVPEGMLSDRERDAMVEAGVIEKTWDPEKVPSKPQVEPGANKKPSGVPEGTRVPLTKPTPK